MRHCIILQCTFMIILISTASITSNTLTLSHSNEHTLSTKLFNDNSSANTSEDSATHEPLLHFVVNTGLLLVTLFLFLLLTFTCLMCLKPPVTETIVTSNDRVMKMMVAAQTASIVTASRDREDDQQKVKAGKTKVMAKMSKGGGDTAKKAPSSSSAAAVSKQTAINHKSSSRVLKRKRTKAMPSVGDGSGKQQQQQLSKSKLKAKSTQMGHGKKKRG